MAYLDDKNEGLYPAGDPLEALDRELAELKETLGNLGEQSQGEQTVSEEITPDPEETKDSERPDEPIKEPEDTLTEPPQEPVKQATAPTPPPKKRGALVAVIVILVLLLIGGVGFGVYRMLTPTDKEPTANGKVVTVTDSEMGTIALQTAKGAKLNTYTKENLTTDENGNYAYYEDGVKISHLGVDLSEFQTNVDFAALKNAGVEFVMLRVGGRYYGEKGALYEDSAFENFYEQATAAGLKVGAYFLSQSITTDEAKDEAAFILKKLNGKKLDYPIAFDWEIISEDEARTDNITGSELTLMAEAFCDAIREAGYQTIVYANTDQMFTLYDFETMKDYDFWLADYRDFPSMYYKFHMWQYTKTGSIDGVEGTVDLNLSFEDFSE